MWGDGEKGTTWARGEDAGRGNDGGKGRRRDAWMHREWGKWERGCGDNGKGGVGAMGDNNERGSKLESTAEERARMSKATGERDDR